MDPHPDFGGTALPRAAEIGAFRLTPLDATVMDEDFEAVTGSIPILRGLFGTDWPEGLTKQNNLSDLHWHDREFTLRRSFSWVVRGPDGSYLGCAYLMPDPGTRGTAQVTTWIRDRPDRDALTHALNAELALWFSDLLPEEINLRWACPKP